MNERIACLIPGHVLTLEPHQGGDCLDIANCPLCRNRCHPGYPGHLFPGDGSAPCHCRAYPNVQACLDDGGDRTV